MLKPIKLWLLGSLLMFSMGFLHLTQAGIVTNLYDVTLTSQTQSEEEWQSLVKEGLTQVLERANGDTKVQENPQVKRALENAADYVEQYAYEGNLLTVKYSQELVNQLVGKVGRPAWGQRRPKVVLWLAIEDQRQRRLVGVESDPTLQSYIDNFSRQKGLPLILPLMDLEDLSAVTVTDVWGQFPTVLQQASKRYDAQSILIGRVMHHEGDGPDSWEAKWELLNQTEIPLWKVQGQSLEEVLSQGLTAVVQHFKGNMVKPQVGVSQNALKGTPFLIGVEEIHSSTDFNRVESYLKGLDSVVDVNVLQVLGTMAVFEITPRAESGRESLARAISMDHQLITSVMGEHSLPDVDMVYRWTSPLSGQTLSQPISEQPAVSTTDQVLSNTFIEEEAQED